MSVSASSHAAWPPADSRFKVIGLGGVGSIVLDYLALYLASLNQPGRLVLIDGDIFEPQNAQRMRFEEPGLKAEVKAVEFARRLANSQIAVVPVPEFIGRENLSRLIRDGDFVFLCVDNHPTRRLVSEHCERLENITLLSGGNDGVEPPQRRGTYGNVQIHVRRAGRDQTPAITRYHPEIGQASGTVPGGPDCAQQALSSPQILMANLAVASHMLNTFYASLCGQLTYQEVQFDILEGRAVSLALTRGDSPSRLSTALAYHEPG